MPGEDEDLEGSDEAAAAAGAANGQEEEDPLQADDPWAPAAGQAAGGDRPGAQSPGHAASDGDAPPPEFVKWFYNLWQQQRHQEPNSSSAGSSVRGIWPVFRDKCPFFFWCYDANRFGWASPHHVERLASQPKALMQMFCGWLHFFMILSDSWQLVWFIHLPSHPFAPHHGSS